MGTDIHAHFEYQDEDGVWHSLDKWSENTVVYEDEDPDGNPVTCDEVEYSHDRRNPLSAPTRRNYEWFAMLASVRNSPLPYAPEHANNDPITPISEPRGLPQDTTEEVRRHADYWGGDGHSHSWITLADLRQYDFMQIITLRGYVDAVNYHRWCGRPRENGDSPKEWCAWVGGRPVEIVDEDEMNRRLQVAIREVDQRQLPERERSQAFYDAVYGLYTLCEWQRPFYLEAGSSAWETFVKMQAIANERTEGDCARVRMVFWFDN